MRLLNFGNKLKYP